jgi:hypothetical protein
MNCAICVSIRAGSQEVLGRYDLVFAKAKCAIEAMVVGAAVIVCDANGLGGYRVRNGYLRRLWWAEPCWPWHAR